MNILIRYIAIAIVALYGHMITAQTNDNVKFNKKTFQIEQLKKSKENIIKEEKRALKKKVIAIEKQRDEGKLSEEDAQKLKEEAAVLHALNIENRIAIVDNEIALLERNGPEKEWFTGSSLELGLGQPYANGDRLFGIRFNKGKKPVKYDKRTTSDLIFAFGLNNAIQDGISLNDSDYRFGGSRFLELGWAWKTRVFKNTNFLRFTYGLSFQFNSLRPTGNRFFVDEEGQTTLQDFEFDLDRSKLRVTNLVVPVHFEFGPSNKWEGDEYIRYSTRRRFKVGIGGYGGFNIGTRQKLVFREDGDRVRQKNRSDFNVNNLIYGLSSYIGWGNTSLYLKYDLNPLFNDDQPEQQNVSLGVRFDW